MLAFEGTREFAIVHEARRVPPMVLVSEVIARPSASRSRIRVLAAYETSRMPGRHRLVLGDCRTGTDMRSLDPDVLALVRVTGDTVWQAPRAAWRVRAERDSIVAIDPTSLRCSVAR